MEIKVPDIGDFKNVEIIEVLVKLNEESIKLVKNYTGMKVIARFLP